MRSRLLWRQMVALVIADSLIACAGLAKHLLLMINSPGMNVESHLAFFRAVVLPSMGISLGMEIGIGAGFAAACNGSIWVTRALNFTLVPATLMAIAVSLLLVVTNAPARVSTNPVEGVFILCCCVFTVICYCCGLVWTAGAPRFIRQRTCTQSAAYLANTLITYLPMSVILITDPVSAHQMLFSTHAGWQVINLIMVSKGAVNICTYMIWVHKESHGRESLARARHPSSASFDRSALENAILDTYFSLSGNEDDVSLEANRAVALAVCQARHLRCSG